MLKSSLGGGTAVAFGHLMALWSNYKQQYVLARFIRIGWICICRIVWVVIVVLRGRNCWWNVCRWHVRRSHCWNNRMIDWLICRIWDSMRWMILIGHNTSTTTIVAIGWVRRAWNTGWRSRSILVLIDRVVGGLVNAYATWICWCMRIMSIKESFQSSILSICSSIDLALSSN